MNVKTDTILVTIAIILGLISTLLFIVTGLFKSPITDAMLVFTFGTLVLFGTQQAGGDTLTQGGLILFSITTVSSVLYIATKFRWSELMLSGVFALFTLAFLASAYLYNREKEVLTEKRVKVLLVSVVVLFVLIGGVDVVSGTPSAEVQLNENVTVTENSQYKIGTLQVTNPSILPQEYEYPRHEVCYTGIDSEQVEEHERPEHITDRISYYDSPNIITGQISTDIVVRYPADELSDDVVVKKSDACPESTEEPTIHFLGEY